MGVFKPKAILERMRDAGLGSKRYGGMLNGTDALRGGACHRWLSQTSEWEVRVLSVKLPCKSAWFDVDREGSPVTIRLDLPHPAQ